MEILFKIAFEKSSFKFLSFSSYYMRVTLQYENTIFYNEVKQSIKSIWIFYSYKTLFHLVSI